MHVWFHALSSLTRSCRHLWSALLLLVLTVGLSWASDDLAHPALTDAQQAAKQLAATLEAENSRATSSRSPVPLVNLTSPSSYLGQRIVGILYTSDRVEVRVVRGRNTLVSPVDDVTAISTDARRPTLRQADDGAMAVEVLVD